MKHLSVVLVTLLAITGCTTTDEIIIDEKSVDMNVYRQDLAECRSWLRHFFDHEIAPAIETRTHAGDANEIRLVGTGGTVTILARMKEQMRSFDRGLIEQTRLSRAEITDWMGKLWRTSLAERQQFIGLPPNRADIIPFGVAIYEAVMQHFDLPTCLYCS